MFAADYFAARGAFRRAAGGACDALELNARGPNNEGLTIDVAWLGDPAAERLLLVTSGIHGVEGFAGSAVQCAFLGAGAAIPPGCAAALVHGLNPWGFAHLRRVNENNVDLNRNFLRSGEHYRGAPPMYKTLDGFLNPKSPPGPDAFHVLAGFNLLRHGSDALRQTIAGGQYEFERGLFYGGSRLERAPELFLNWLVDRCSGVKRLLAIDLHSGLGPFAALSLFAGSGAEPTRVRRLADALQSVIASDAAPVDGVGYSARGSMREFFPQALPRADIDALTVEFGTFSGLRLLYALREENRLHHYGDGALDHPAKRRLLAGFRPDSAAWRVAVIARGTALLQRALSVLQNEP